jgi:transposase InsO family protein
MGHLSAQSCTEYRCRGPVRRSNYWLRLLYVLVIVRLERRDLVWINVTASPTAEWIACQITEAFPWNAAPRYLIRDRDGVYGATVMRRLRAMGIRDKPIAPGSPWQNGFAERLIESIRHECVHHVVALGEGHLRRVLRSYARYYNESRTHRALNKDAPFHRAIERRGAIISRPVLMDFTTDIAESSFRYTQGEVPAYQDRR